MMKGVHYHVQEEENELLPTAQQQLGTKNDRLGTQMQQRKQEL
jgi:hemerythrin-like domain-containing protein